MKFVWRDGLIYVPVTVTYNKSVELEAIVDTGSAGTVFDIDLFDIELLTRDPEIVNIVGVGGKQEVLQQTVEQVRIGEILIEQFPAQFGDLDNAFDIKGIIGGDFLNYLDAVIDYEKKIITFSFHS